MVKGVNKTVIEVNNTGSKLFEKIVFYVTPQYGSLSAKQLKRAAGEFAFNFEGNSSTPPLRKRVRRLRKRRLALIAALALFVICAVVTICLIL